MTQTPAETGPGGPDAGTGTRPRIVVGIDGSESSVEALNWAARQADSTGASLEVVMTWDWPISYGWTIPYPSGFDPSESAQQVLNATVAVLREAHPGLDVITRLVEGHPAPILIEASKGASLLVVGSRGHGEFAGMLLGSVSEHCATHAHCPVLVHRS